MHVRMPNRTYVDGCGVIFVISVDVGERRVVFVCYRWCVVFWSVFGGILVMIWLLRGGGDL